MVHCLPWLLHLPWSSHLHQELQYQVPALLNCPSLCQQLDHQNNWRAAMTIRVVHLLCHLWFHQHSMMQLRNTSRWEEEQIFFLFTFTPIRLCSNIASTFLFRSDFTLSRWSPSFLVYGRIRVTLTGSTLWRRTIGISYSRHLKRNMGKSGLPSTEWIIPKA